MTTILIAKTRIYADCAHYKDGERFMSMTKIKPLKEPLPIKWVPRPGVTIDQERFPAEFTDTIHGYAVTGANPSGNAFIAQLENVKGDMDHMFEFYYNVAKHHLTTQGNHFTILLIGEKCDYAFSLEYTEVVLTVLGRDNPTAFGNGAHFAMREWYRTNDSIRAMYHTFWHEETSGGMIDCWDLPTETFPHLRRVGICNERTKAQLLAELGKPLDPKLSMDFVTQAFCEEVARASSRMGEFIGEHRVKEKQGEVRKKATTKPSRKTTPTRKRKVS